MKESIESLLSRQTDFFRKGVTKQYAFRMKALCRLEHALEEWEEDLKEALWQDLHKSESESYMTEIGLVKAEITHVKRNLWMWMKKKPLKPFISQLPGRGVSVPEPYGNVLIMAPWNYPVLLCLEPLVDAIAAGNCVILKPSAYASEVSGVLKDMISSIFPTKYVAVIEGGREQNEQLLEQRYDHIFFTGGTEVGRIVLEKAAQYLTPVTLELGGKSPCIVDETADLSLAAKRIAFGKLLNAGQTCVAPDYIVVHESVKDRLIARLVEEFWKMLGDHPFDNPDYPKIINEKHFERLVRLMEGEKLAYGGAVNRKSRQIEPTILCDVNLDSKVMAEEIFGPILPVLPYKSKKELAEIVHHFEKPLALYLFTRSRVMKEWVSSEFSFGGGCVNDTVMHLTSPHMPFGGVGCSGMGSYHGKAGFETFSHRKHVLYAGTIIDNPLRYQPYTEWKDKLVRFFL